MYKITFDKIEWQNSPNGVRSKTYPEDTKQLRLLEFGQDLDHPEWCLRGHLGYVLEGELEIEFVDKIIRLKKGEGLSIPAGEQDKHRPKALSEMVRLIFIEDV